VAILVVIDPGGGFHVDRRQRRRMQKKLREEIKRKMTKQNPLSEKEVREIDDIYDLSTEMRWRLYW